MEGYDDDMQEDEAPSSPATNPVVDSIEDKVRQLREKNQSDFGAWTSLITEVERNEPDNIGMICLVYDSFLCEFPLCYGYWRKYACHNARLCTSKEVEEVYERAVKEASYSVDIWISYCSFGELSYEDPADVRKLYERSLSFVGNDYSCHLLWDRYIKFEYTQKQWVHLARIYINTLRFPSKKLCSYYERFRKLVAIWEEEMGQVNAEALSTASPICDLTDTKPCGYAEISNVIRDLLIQDGLYRPHAVKKYKSVGELLYQKSSQLDKKINCFETRIYRPYFHVKPLDDNQLDNWHQYLDFVEMHGDLDWTVKLYERCLIPCANYSEFWIRYVRFAEAKGGREIANYAIDRASTVFLKNVPAFRVYSSIFKEKIGDVDGARASFLRCSRIQSTDFIENVNREANMEKRMGNIELGRMIYVKAIELAKEKQNEETFSVLCTHFARFTYTVSSSVDAAREVFVNGIHQMPCRLIVEGLINFLSMHGTPEQIPLLDPIVENAIYPGSDLCQALSFHDREVISKLFIEFVDIYGTISEIRTAWDRHWKLFPHIIRPSPVDTTTYHNSSADNIPLAKKMEGGNEMLLDLSHGTCVHDSCVGSDMHAEDTSSIGNDAATIENLPLDNYIKGQNQLSVPNSPSASDNTDSVQHVNNSSVENKSAICESHIIAVENKTAMMCDSQLEETKSCTKGTEHLVECSALDQTMSTSDGNKLHLGFGDSVHEPHNVIQISQASTEYAETENLVGTNSEQELYAGLRPPELDSLSINSPDNGIQPSSLTHSHDLTLKEATPCTDENKQRDGSISNEDDVVQPGFRKDSSPVPLIDDQTTPDAHSSPPLQTQVVTQTDSQQDLLVDSASLPNDSSKISLNITAPSDTTIGQTSQEQQWHISTQLQCSPAATNSQMAFAQGYPCHSQMWTNTHDQLVSQSQGQYSMAVTTQVYPSGSVVWPGHNMQQQGYAYTQSQPSTQPSSQPQVYHQSLQGNGQYAYFQSGQGVHPHLVHYYQQQLYYMQQNQEQQQQNQQLNNYHQQQFHIDHLQQLQHSLSHQQQSVNQLKPQPQIPELLNHQEQHQQLSHLKQNVQQQQSQFQQQNQQIDQTQQQQYILYLQQQQQMYLQQQQQQQQLYLQQQQQHQQQQQQQQQQQLYLHQQQQLQLQQQQLQLQLQQQQQKLHISSSEATTSSSNAAETSLLHNVEQQSAHCYPSTSTSTPEKVKVSPDE